MPGNDDARYYKHIKEEKEAVKMNKSLDYVKSNVGANNMVVKIIIADDEDMAFNQGTDDEKICNNIYDQAVVDLINQAQNIVWSEKHVNHHRGNEINKALVKFKDEIGANNFIIGILDDEFKSVFNEEKTYKKIAKKLCSEING